MQAGWRAGVMYGRLPPPHELMSVNLLYCRPGTCCMLMEKKSARVRLLLSLATAQSIYFFLFGAEVLSWCARFCRVGRRTLWSAKHCVSAVVGRTPGNRLAELLVSLTKA